MRYFNRLWHIAGIVSFSMMAGCGTGTSDEVEPELPAWLSESSDESGIDEPDFGSLSATSAGDTLQPGDRFPLRKVVDQELTQTSLSGAPAISRSRLEVLFTLSVVDVSADQTRLNVRYDRVQYQHDVGDDHVSYDSTRPPLTIPVAVRPYHNMVNHGFSFWLGADHRVVSVEGLTEFLNHCLLDVPPEQRQQVMLNLGNSSGASGISSFVDVSIGLLPNQHELVLGETWDQTHLVQHPVAMQVNETYTLTRIEQDVAQVDIRGTISPASPASAVDAGHGASVRVTGGATTGNCTVSRDTGLPMESHMDRTIQMSVTMAGMLEFQQQKRVTTTVESISPNATSQAAIRPSDSPNRSETGPLLR